MLSKFKKILYPASIIIFFSFTFQSNPPGWYQQTLPVNDVINDIFFVDSLTGWLVTNGRADPADTGYILKTTNGGNNWQIQYGQLHNLNSIFMLNNSTGYAGGGTGNGTSYLFKTINGGLNWNLIVGSSGTGGLITGIQFVNENTGWYMDNGVFDGGIFKTINSGSNWVRQANPLPSPRSIFMLNQDTGWYGCSSGTNDLFKTTNGGINWNIQFSSAYPITSIFFLNKDKGWIRGAASNQNSLSYTTNGGSNWIGVSNSAVALGHDVKFINDSIGYSGATLFKIPKSTDGGKTWGYQPVPTFEAIQIAILKGDTNRIWAGSIGLIHTTDGGGTIVSAEIEGTIISNGYKLFQNYPNPFNSITNIEFRMGNFGFVQLHIYNLNGKLIETLVNKNMSSGNYKVSFDAKNLPSGIYFYTLNINDKFIETKKMILLK